jgi:hypothetical protein
MASQAIHIEVACSLNTSSIIQALQRFIARRGPVREIRSDNRTNFVGANKELSNALKEMDSDIIQNWLVKLERTGFLIHLHQVILEVSGRDRFVRFER